MVAQIPLPLQALDAFSALGLGLLLAAGYDALRFVVGGARVPVFFCDLLAFALSAAALVSFGVSCSYTGFFRWPMALGMGAGFLIYFAFVAPFTAALRAVLVFVLLLPLRLAQRLLLAPLAACLRREREKLKKKRSQRRKTRQDHLQRRGKVLYNSN